MLHRKHFAGERNVRYWEQLIAPSRDPDSLFIHRKAPSIHSPELLPTLTAALRNRVGIPCGDPLRRPPHDGDLGYLICYNLLPKARQLRARVKPSEDVT